MVPCVEYKCLKYPACKHKTEVICDLILEWYRKGKTKTDNWNQLHEVMPLLVSLVPEVKSKLIPIPIPAHLRDTFNDTTVY